MSYNMIKISLADMLFYLGRLAYGPLICLYNRRAQRPALPVNAETAHHLAAEGYGGNLVRRNTGSADQLLCGGADGISPIVCILFHPCAVKITGIVRFYPAADQLSVCGK